MLNFPSNNEEENKGRFLDGIKKSSGNSLNSYGICKNCNEDLNLQSFNIDAKVLKKIKGRYSELRNMEQNIIRNQSHVCLENFNLEDTGLFCGDCSLYKQQYFNKSSFPLINLSKPRSEQKFTDWKHISNQMKNVSQNCQLLHSSAQLRKSHPKERPRHLPELAVTRELKKLLMKNLNKKNKLETLGLLRAEPQTILFDDFQIGLLYRKKLRITNTSSSSCKFMLCPLPGDSQFKVRSSELTLVLAAGMSVALTVEFLCRSLADITEELVLKVPNRNNVTVSLQATSPPPHLVEISNGCSLPSEEKVISEINCGSLLLGEECKVNMTWKNIGSSARFCFVSETDWYNTEHEINSSNCLRDGCFTVEPMLFSLDKDQTIDVSIIFKPQSKGFQTSQAFLLCENTSLKQVDFTGDGLLYHPSWIQPVGMLKTFTVDIPDDDSAEFYLDLEQLHVLSTNFYCFFLIHNGYVNLSYHWEVRAASVPEFRCLPTEALRVVPASGRLSTGAVETFCVLCDTSSVLPGHYRLLLALVVDDLPRKCIPVKFHEKIVNVSDEETEALSIEQTLIEVWLECVELNIILHPFIVDFTDIPLICGSCKETREILVENQSPGVIKLMWYSVQESPLVKLEIEPASFECKGFMTSKCTLLIEALLQGTFVIVLKYVNIESYPYL